MRFDMMLTVPLWLLGAGLLATFTILLRTPASRLWLLLCCAALALGYLLGAGMQALVAMIGGGT